MRHLAGGQENIEYIKRSYTPPTSDTVVRSVEVHNSRYEILMWYDQTSKTIYYFTEGEKIILEQYGIRCLWEHRV